MTFFSRLSGLLLSPRSEWATIANESPTAATYLRYPLILSVILALYGAIALFVRNNPDADLDALLDQAAPLSLVALIFYGTTVITFLVTAQLVVFLAPKCGGHTDPNSAMRLLTHAFTPQWLSLGLYALALLLLPTANLTRIMDPIITASFPYMLYLLYLGMQPITRCTDDRIGVMTSITFAGMFATALLLGIAFSVLVMLAAAAIMPSGSMA